MGKSFPSSAICAARLATNVLFPAPRSPKSKHRRELDTASRSGTATDRIFGTSVCLMACVLGRSSGTSTDTRRSRISGSVPDGLTCRERDSKLSACIRQTCLADATYCFSPCRRFWPWNTPGQGYEGGVIPHPMIANAVLVNGRHTRRSCI